MNLPSLKEVMDHWYNCKECQNTSLGVIYYHIHHEGKIQTQEYIDPKISERYPLMPDMFPHIDIKKIEQEMNH